VHLPGRSGLQLQAELSQTAMNCPIVFISAFSDEHARTQAIQAGAVDFLPKPLESERLLGVIQRALGET
jgi:FixJ family two-component response regulator